MMLKRIWALLLALVLLLSLGGCKEDEKTPAGPLQTYSVHSEAVDVGPKGSVAYDLGFLSRSGHTISDSCWVGSNRLLILTTVADTDSYEDQNLPQETSLYMLNTGDSTVELLYSGQHYLSSLQNLSGDKVAIVSPVDVTVFNYAQNKISSQREISNPDELSSPVELSPNGKYFAVDRGATIEIQTSAGGIARTLKPEDLGYAWLSEPAWAADNNHLAFFCGKDEYGIDDIAIVEIETDGEPVIHKYYGQDAYPYWADLGESLLVMKNFHYTRKADKEIEIYDLAEHQFRGSAIKTPYTGDLSLVFANTLGNRYYFIAEGKLYRQSGTLIEQLTDSSLWLTPDSISFSLTAQSAAVFGDSTDGESVYILDLSTQ